MLNDIKVYGREQKIRLFYKDNVLIDYLLSNEEIKLEVNERLDDSTLLHTYYDIIKAINPEYNHKTIIFNIFVNVYADNLYQVSKDWNTSRQYVSAIYVGKQNVSKNLETKISEYFNFDIKLFDENFFNELKNK